MTAPNVPFTFTDDDKRKLAKAFCEHVGDPYKGAMAVFGHLKNPGIVLYAANQLQYDAVVMQEVIRLTTAGNVGELLANKDQAARTVWEWTQSPNQALKDKIAAMELYCQIQGITKKEEAVLPPMLPPIIQYVVDPDAGTAPNPAVAAAA